MDIAAKFPFKAANMVAPRHPAWLRRTYHRVLEARLFTMWLLPFAPQSAAAS